MSDTTKAPYDLERYAKALERMAIEFQVPIDGPDKEEDMLAYAQKIIRLRGYNLAMKYCYQRAAEMLRGTPTSLYTTYPDYFPDPNEEGGDE